MKKESTTTLVHRAYFATIITNSAIAVGDVTVGFLFLYRSTITTVLTTSKHLHGIAKPVTETLTHAAGVGAFYFFSHGIVKLFLLWGLLQKKLWAYPIAMLFLTGFNVYQIMLLARSFSWLIMGLLLFNSMTVLLIAAEYRQVQALMRIEK